MSLSDIVQRSARGIGQGYLRAKRVADPLLVAAGTGAMAAAALYPEMGGLEMGISAAAGAAATTIGEDVSERTGSLAATAAAYSIPTTAAAIALSAWMGEDMRSSIEALPYIGGAMAAGMAYVKALPAAFKAGRWMNANEGGVTRRILLKGASTAVAATAVGGGVWSWVKEDRQEDVLETIIDEGPVRYVQRGDDMFVEIMPYPGEGYLQLASEMTSSSQNAATLEKINGPLMRGKTILVPEEMISEEFGDLSEAIVDYLRPEASSLWSISEDYTVSPTAMNRGEKILKNARIIQRLSRLPDERSISGEEMIVVPRGLLTQDRTDIGKVLEDYKTATRETSDEREPPKKVDGLDISTKYFQPRAQRPRRRPIGWRQGRQVFEDEPRDIDMIVLHTTETPSNRHQKGTLELMQRKHSTNYAIGREGEIYMIVDPRFTANHAGSTLWDGQEGLAFNSIGIEVVAKVEGRNKQPINDKQYHALTYLTSTLRKQYEIPPQQVLGHNQVAVTKTRYGMIRGRKGDPGKDFDWGKAGLPNNYELLDPDILAGRVLPNPDAVRAGRVTSGQYKSFERAGR